MLRGLGLCGIGWRRLAGEIASVLNGGGQGVTHGFAKRGGIVMHARGFVRHLINVVYGAQLCVQREGLPDQSGRFGNCGLGGGGFGSGFLRIGVAQNFRDAAREIVDAARESAGAGFLAAFDERCQFLDGVQRGLVQRDFALERVSLCGEALALAGRCDRDRFVECVDFGLVLVNTRFQGAERLREILLLRGAA